MDDTTVLSKVGAALFRQTYSGQIPLEEMSAHLDADFNEEQQRSELADAALVTLLVEYFRDVVGFAQVRRRRIPVVDAPQADVELWCIYLDRKWHGMGVAQ